MDAFKIEQLGQGADTGENTGAIVNSEIYFSISPTLQSIPGPLKDNSDPDITSVESLVTITDDLVYKSGYAATKVKAIIEKNGFESNMIGPKKGKAWENKLTITLVANEAALMGYLRLIKNQDLLIHFKTFGTGAYRQLGSEVYAASLLEAKEVIPEAVENDAVCTITIGDKQKYPAPFYKGARTIYPVA